MKVEPLINENKQNLITVFIMGQAYKVPAEATIMGALEYAGYQIKRGAGCREGFCGACGQCPLQRPDGGRESASKTSLRLGALDLHFPVFLEAASWSGERLPLNSGRWRRAQRDAINKNM